MYEVFDNRYEIRDGYFIERLPQTRWVEVENPQTGELETRWPYEFLITKTIDVFGRTEKWAAGFTLDPQDPDLQSEYVRDVERFGQTEGPVEPKPWPWWKKVFAVVNPIYALTEPRFQKRYMALDPMKFEDAGRELMETTLAELEQVVDARTKQMRWEWREEHGFNRPIEPVYIDGDPARPVH